MAAFRWSPSRVEGRMWWLGLEVVSPARNSTALHIDVTGKSQVLENPSKMRPAIVKMMRDSVYEDEMSWTSRCV